MTAASEPPPDRPLVPIPSNEVSQLVALALNLTKGRKREEAIAREANSAVGDRLLAYFEASGIVLMRPAPRPPHSNNPDAQRISLSRSWDGA